MRTVQRTIVGAFIVSSDNYIVLGKTVKGGVYAGQYVIPGGGVEIGEELLAALKREVLEEANLDCDQLNAHISLLNNTARGTSEKTLPSGERIIADMHFHDFLVRIPLMSDQVPLKPGDDFAQAQWMPLSVLPLSEMVPTTVTALLDAGLIDPINDCSEARRPDFK